MVWLAQMVSVSFPNHYLQQLYLLVVVVVVVWDCIHPLRWFGPLGHLMGVLLVVVLLLVLSCDGGLG